MVCNWLGFSTCLRRDWILDWAAVGLVIQCMNKQMNKCIYIYIYIHTHQGDMEGLGFEAQGSGG